MKKLFIGGALLALLAGSISSCKKRIEDDYQNPELTTTGNIGKLFTGMFLNKRIHPSYWDYYTLLMPYTGTYAGLVGTPTSSNMYMTSNSYTDGRWTDFYNGSLEQDYNYNGPGIMNSYREMQTSYKALAADKRAAQDVYMHLAEVILYDQASQMVDEFGDIPFTQASSLNSDRTIVFAAYDKAADLYDTMITKLAVVNAFLDTATVADAEVGNLKLYDRVYQGDLKKWQRYANSLRLRLLMRISNVSESKAQPLVAEMLNNPAKFPLISSNDQDALVWNSPTTLVSDLLAVFTDFRYAPQWMLEEWMVPNNDPRTDVFFDPDQTNGYKGFPYTGSSTDYSKPGYATYDSATFFYNYNLPGVLFTAAEASLLQAEAQERWSLGDAAASYATGVTQSVEFWYNVNAKQSLRSSQYSVWTPIKLADGAVAAYLAMPDIAYTGTATEKLSKIYTQKWENFFVVQSQQAWAEYRRTGYPVLNLPTTSGIQQTPPTRFMYPSNEELYNTENYLQVRDQNTRNTKIFWAK